MTDEMMDLMEPYLNLKLPNGDPFYTAKQAKSANAALAGLAVWSRAMYDYHNASKIVKPKLEMLQIK